ELIRTYEGLSYPGPARSIAWSEIEKVEREVGSRKDGGRIGAVVGGFGGVALVLAYVGAASEFSGYTSPGSEVALMALTGGALGAAVGWGLGSLVGLGVPQWHPVYERR